MPDEQRWTRLENDVDYLKNWTSRHEDEHSADTNLLSAILNQLHTHEGNHHGVRSIVKQSWYAGILASLIVAGGELIKRFFL